MTAPTLMPSPTVLFKEMDEGAVLFCSRTEVYFGLNPVGVLIWKALQEGPRTEAQLIQVVAQAFPGAELEVVTTDVHEFVGALEADELVIRGESAESAEAAG